MTGIGTKLTVSEALQRAMASHRAGNLVEAERLYRQICAVDPKNVDCLHFLGVLMGQVGRNDIAIDLIGRALALKPDYVEAHYNLGNFLAMANRLDRAAVHYKRVLALKPDSAEAHHSLGVVLANQGRPTEAVAYLERALVLEPNFAEAHYLLGNLLAKENRLDRAAAHYKRVVALKPDLAEAHNSLATVVSDQGKPTEAMAYFKRALALKPDFIEAHYNLGNFFRKENRLDQAEAQYERVLALKPDYLEAHCNLGNMLMKQGRIADAVIRYQRVLALKPDYAEAHNGLGAALLVQGKATEAMACFERALALRPDFVDALYNRGNTLRELERLDEALASFDKALAIKPDYAEAFNNRGITLHELMRFDEALASYHRAIALKPDYADIPYNRGNALRELERFDEALASYEAALAIKPDYAEAFSNRGITLHELKRFEEALASFDKAIVLKPDYAEAFNNRGVTLRELDRFEEAMASYDKAIAFRPDYAEAFNSRGHLLNGEGKWAEAVIDFERALALKPDYATAKFARCMAQLPVLYRDEPEIAERRATYQQYLQALCDDLDGRRMKFEDFAKAAGSSQPFFLAYQGYNDRDLQSLYGSFMCRVMAQGHPPAALSSPPQSDEPVRLGIVSGFFRQHSNWKIPIKGWLSQIDRKGFRVFGYHTGVIEDAETRQAAALCDRFVQGPLSINRWRQAILDDALHILIYPEVGMNAVAAQLAAQRLAPVQCNSWGHPDTSGFPTLDYYLSSELMEPPDGQDHYTERLVRLPNLSIYYEPFEPQSVALPRTDLGLRPTATIYWCGQSLYKYLPQFDNVFPRIALEAGDCQFAFIQYWQGTHLNGLFLQRLERAFAAFGLRAADYCVLLPRLDTSRFVAAIGQCDIVLDSIGWSGCNSTLEGLHHDLPIVTMTGPLMRGRHTTAILKMATVDETITEKIDDYISIAIRLARDLPWRMAVKNKISENKHRLYRDTTCVSALQKFLDSVTRGAV